MKDINCLPNQKFITILEGFYLAFLFAPVMLFVLAFVEYFFLERNIHNLANVTFCWGIASSILCMSWPKGNSYMLDWMLDRMAISLNNGRF